MRCADSFRPAAATWSRHGAIARIPRRAQPATISGNLHCVRTRRGVDRQQIGIGRPFVGRRRSTGPRQPPAAMQRQQRLHPGAGERRIGEQARHVGEAEKLDQMQQIARTLLSPDHHEMILPSVEPSQKYDTGLVEASRCAEHMARQGHRRREDGVEHRRGLRRRALRARPRRRGRSGRRCRAAHHARSRRSDRQDRERSAVMPGEERALRVRAAACCNQRVPPGCASSVSGVAPGASSRC